ncbi:DDE-domain-containing protein [Dendrothele bispora CBS 962.96]|uniref:DDE-domain-containing protein n=1 Tax=Dendrothele bispora (strain CBS 962.96) TaxID=1314807 RepID=A0A4S8M6Q4_DENBC|nr:DDE-domain-containing protein [Dendrothele bispora CBS 962.96]
MSAELMWAFDEIGFSETSGGATAVIGRTGRKQQYQQRGNNQELTTVLVTICADGSTIPPAQIFKGKGVGYSKKGWTDNEIGLEYAQHFDLKTREKANGQWRCLSVDSHASHVSRAFLQYCRQHKIHVPCYPSHSTHIYQGLDVVCFSPLKIAFGKERDRYLRETGLHITKDSFAMIYGRAHLRTMTPELIKTAFRKTGLWPIDHNVVTADMMAPSKATSTQVYTLVQPPTPVRIVTDLLVDVAKPPTSQPFEAYTFLISPVKQPAGDLQNLLEL